MKRLIFIVLALLGSLILEDQVQAQLVWNPTIFAPAVNPPGGANNYGESSGQGGFIYTGPIAPANPTEGMLWYDNSTVPQTLKIWDGTTWVTVLGQTADNSGPTPPSNPTDGQLWYDTSTLPATLKVWDGTTWVTVRAGILNSPTFAGSITILNNATVNGPDGSTWTNSGINNLKNLNIATGGALTFHGVPIGGACAANQFMISLSSEIIPTCAAITNIPGPVTINNPTFTGTVTMPDGSVWNNTSLTYPNTTVINGPDGSVWNSTGITNVKNISLVTGGAITIGGQPVSGGAHVGPTAPASPSAGQLWWDTSVTPAVLKIYNGTAWVVAGGGGGVTSGTTPPSPPTTGTLWYDTSTTPPTLKVWNGTAWVATNSAIVAPTAPSNASEGQFWFNTTDIQTYVRFNGQWVAVVNIVGGGGGAGVTVGPTAPASPKTGELWYDSVAGALKVWNGSTWASTAPSGAAPSSITDAMLVSAYSGIGTCSANQYVTALNRNAAPTCAAVTLPAGVTLNNPTLTGTITLPDGSTWTSAGLTIVAGSRAHTLDSLTGASGSTAGALQRASNGSWSVAAFSLPSGSTIVSPSISNPTFAGTLTFPSASIADAALANSYSGVGTCTAGQFVNALNRNAGPTCASPAAGNFAPFLNPSGGQNNYAPLANASFTGTLSINGVSLTGGPWLPVNNPTYTGTMKGPNYIVDGTQTQAGMNVPMLSWQSTAFGVIAALSNGYGNSDTSSFLIGQNMYYTALGATPWKSGGGTYAPNAASSIQLYGASVAFTGNTAVAKGANFVPKLLFSVSPVAYNAGGFEADSGILPGAVFRLPANTGLATFQLFAGNEDEPFFTAGTQGGVHSRANWIDTVSEGVGNGAYAANYVDVVQKGNHQYLVQQMNGDTTDLATPDSALLQTTAIGGLQINSLGAGASISVNGDLTINSGFSYATAQKTKFYVGGYPVGAFRFDNYAQVGLSLGGFACRLDDCFPNTALSIGNSYYTSHGWATAAISGAAYYDGGQWIRDGGAGSGVSLWQQTSAGAGLYFGDPGPAGSAVGWVSTVVYDWARQATRHIENNTNYPPPYVWGCGGASLVSGSRDSFGEIYCPEASQDVGMNFAIGFNGNSVCTFTDDGQPLLWFPYNKGQYGTYVQCRNPISHDYCWGPQWFTYQCFGVGY